MPQILFSQNINMIDESGKKQGVWKKNFDNGNLKYNGFFINDNPSGIFNYYYKTGELKIEKEFFHNGSAAATYVFYRDGSLKASGLYVNQLKDSTWNYFNDDSILVLSEQYKAGNLNGFRKSKKKL